MPPQVKICGITQAEALKAAANAGASYAGLVFYQNSPRYLSYARAAALMQYKPEQLKTVGLFVDPDDAQLDRALAQVNLDMIQLHGAERPQRVKNIRARTKLPVMKALPVARPDDLAAIEKYDLVCDWLLFDAKPVQATDNPGGGGRPFNWALLHDVRPQVPWMLAGGLNVENIHDALDILSPDAVDISSGVELKRGKKDVQMITEFIRTVSSLCT